MTNPDPAAREIEYALATADKIVAMLPRDKWKVCDGEVVVLAAALRQSQARASSLEGRLEAANKNWIRAMKKAGLPRNTRSRIFHHLTALDETGGRKP